MKINFVDKDGGFISTTSVNPSIRYFNIRVSSTGLSCELVKPSTQFNDGDIVISVYPADFDHHYRGLTNYYIGQDVVVHTLKKSTFDECCAWNINDDDRWPWDLESTPYESMEWTPPIRFAFKRESENARTWFKVSRHWPRDVDIGYYPGEYEKSVKSVTIELTKTDNGFMVYERP